MALLSAAVASGVMASTGVTVVALLLLTRWVSHDQVQFSRPVFFDYSEPKVTAAAWFVGDASVGSVVPEPAVDDESEGAAAAAGATR